MAGKDFAQIHLLVPRKRVWAAFCDPQFLPKALPGYIESVEILEGDGISTGSVKILNLGSAIPNARFLKEKVEKFDPENYTITVLTVEGGEIGIAYSFNKFTCKFSEGPGDSTIMDWEFEYEAIVPDPPVGHAKQGVIHTLKAIENYLTANPHIYAA